MHAYLCGTIIVKHIPSTFWSIIDVFQIFSSLLLQMKSIVAVYFDAI